MAFPKFQTKEVLNKVLNSGEDALNVDLADSISVTVDSEFPDVAAISDNFSNPTTTSVMSMLMGWDTSTWDRVQIGGGTQAAALRVTIASDSSGVLSVDDNGSTLTVDVASGGIASGAIASGAVASGALASGSVVDGAMVTLGAKADAKSTATDTTSITAMQVLKQISASVQETATDTGTIDSDTDAIKTAVETIDNAISGTEMQVDVVAALPSGTNTVGKVEAVGDVAEDAAVSGNPVLTGGRYDATARTLDDGDAGALALDPSGALYTREYTGQYGAVYTTASSDVIVPPDGKTFVAIQMLEDTTFDSSGGLIAVTATRWFNTEDAAGDLGSGSESTAEGSGGKQIDNSVTFPQGMTIFGRWSGVDVNSGSVIAYIGDY